jgi:hypothetical protein
MGGLYKNVPITIKTFLFLDLLFCFFYYIIDYPKELRMTTRVGCSLYGRVPLEVSVENGNGPTRRNKNDKPLPPPLHLACFFYIDNNL